MGIRFNASVRERCPDPIRGQGSPGSGRKMVGVGGAVLLVLAFFVLMRYSMFGDVARYSLTGMFWDGTHGVVMSPRPTSAPAIQFNTPDGESNSFTEDYIILCGRSLFCSWRTLTPGQLVPVVYDPARPERAFVHDWDLFYNVLQMWALFGLLILLASVLLLLLSRGRSISFQLGNVRDDRGGS